MCTETNNRNKQITSVDLKNFINNKICHVYKNRSKSYNLTSPLHRLYTIPYYNFSKEHKFVVYDGQNIDINLRQ